MRMVAMLSGMSVKRITRNTHRMAKKDGIMVISRAEGQRNTSRNARKSTLAVSAKRGVGVLSELRPPDSLTHPSAAHIVQCRLTGLNRGPGFPHPCAQRTDPAEELGASPDADPYIG